MKKRIGFVSNSSSSSFTIGINKKIGACPHCGRSGYDLVEILESHEHEETNFVWDDSESHLENLEKDIAYYTNEGWHEEAQDKQKEKEKIQEWQEEFGGNSLIGLEVSNGDDFIHHILEELEKTGEITVLSKEGA